MGNQEQPQKYAEERCTWCGADRLKSSNYCSPGHEKIYARWRDLSDEEKGTLAAKDPDDDDKTAKAKRKKIEKKLAVGLEGKNLQKLKKQQE